MDTPETITARPPAPGTVRRRDSRRRGVVSFVAMIFLIIFAALALGFYAQTNTASQVSYNERRTKESLMAAEAGLHYIRYELSRSTIPTTSIPGKVIPLTNDQVFEEIQMDLKGSVENYSPLSDGIAVGDIVYDPAGVLPPHFNIPADPTQYIAMTPTGPWFRVRIEQQGRDVVVTSVGKSGNSVSHTPRGIEVRFTTKEWPNTVFDFGMASPGKVTVDVSKLVITGTPDDSLSSILSLAGGAGAVTIGNPSSTAIAPTGIEGTVTVMAGSTLTLTGTNYTVGGYKTAAQINNPANGVIKTITEKPEWPTPDGSIFEPFAKNVYNAASTDHVNIRIPANSNPTFTTGHKVRGVIVIEQPNMVNFQAGVVVQAVLIGKDNPAVANDYLKNYIKFSGNGVIKEPLSALDPADARFDGLRELSGTFIIAPGFEAIFTGNFSTVSGNVAADKISVTGNTSGSFQGSLISLTETPMQITGSSAIEFAKPATTAHPGLRFTERFVPSKGSYKEVQPKD